MRELWLFCKSLGHNWKGLMSGSAGIVLTVLGALGVKAASGPLVWVASAVCFVLASYFVWLDAHRELVKVRTGLEDKLAARVEQQEDWERRQRQRRTEGDEERRATIRREHEAFLAENIQCRGGCASPWVPRRDYWLVDGRKGIALKEVCGSCFFRHFGTAPHDDPTAERAYRPEADI